MKIIHFDQKLGELKLVTDTVDDLWHLEKVLSIGSRVEGHTTRTYKVGKKEEKKHVFITIEVERVEFSKSFNRLRILGKIVSGNPEEFVQIGKFHTIEVSPRDKIKITQNWKQHQYKRLKEAEKESKRPKIRIIVLDEQKALTAIVRSFGIEYGAELYSTASKKSEKQQEAERSYFGQIAAEIERHPEKYVVAGPGFTRDNLKKFISQKYPDLLKRIIWETCSYAERSGVNELLKRGALEKIMGEERIEKETKLVEELIVEIHKDSGLAAYGLDEVRRAAAAFAIKKLLVLDEYLRKDPDAEAAVEEADSAKAEIIIISSEEEPGMKLKGFGKIAALLKFKIRD
jgi:protein pelota